MNKASFSARMRAYLVSKRITHVLSICKDIKLAVHRRFHLQHCHFFASSEVGAKVVQVHKDNIDNINDPHTDYSITLSQEARDRIVKVLRDHLDLIEGRSAPE